MQNGKSCDLKISLRNKNKSTDIIIIIKQVPEREMYALTKKNYENLPEVKNKK